MVEEPVQDCGGENVVTEDLPPFAKGFVESDDDGSAFIAAGHQLEDEIGLVPVEWKMPYFVDHEQARFEVGLEFLGEGSGAFGVTEVTDHVVEAAIQSDEPEG